MLVLNAFLAISEGLVSDNQSSPLPHPPPPPTPILSSETCPFGLIWSFSSLDHTTP